MAVLIPFLGWAVVLWAAAVCRYRLLVLKYARREVCEGRGWRWGRRGGYGWKPWVLVLVGETAIRGRLLQEGGRGGSSRFARSPLGPLSMLLDTQAAP